jgi:uncharacterized OB-fold protein
MGLSKCPDCGKPASTQAIVCPHCGRALRVTTFSRMIRLTIFTLLFAAAALAVIWLRAMMDR